MSSALGRREPVEPTTKTGSCGGSRLQPRGAQRGKPGPEAPAWARIGSEIGADQLQKPLLALPVLSVIGNIKRGKSFGGNVLLGHFCGKRRERFGKP